METERKLRLADVFVSITDPRQAKKVQHDLVELLVVAVNAVLVGADTFVEIELWARERLGWLRSYLRLKHGIPSHDTLGRLFGLIDPDEFESAFRRWVSSILPVMGLDTVMPRGRRFPEPAVPSSWHQRYFAIARQLPNLPFHNVAHTTAELRPRLSAYRSSSANWGV